MEALCCISGFILLVTVVVLPYFRYHQAKAQREFEQAYRFFKLRQIYRFYPEVLPIHWRDLEEMYDIDESYHNIGRGALSE